MASQHIAYLYLTYKELVLPRNYFLFKTLHPPPHSLHCVPVTGALVLVQLHASTDRFVSAFQLMHSSYVA